jgi:hypothetical protein
MRFGTSLHCVSGFWMVKELHLDRLSHEVSSTEGLGEHVSCPLGGTAWLTGGTHIECTEKEKVGDRGCTCVTLEGVNPLLTIVPQGFAKEEDEGSTLQLAKLQVVRGARVRP